MASLRQLGVRRADHVIHFAVHHFSGLFPIILSKIILSKLLHPELCYKIRRIGVRRYVAPHSDAEFLPALRGIDPDRE